MKTARKLCHREPSAKRSRWSAVFVLLQFMSVARAQAPPTSSTAQRKFDAKLQLHAPVVREFAPGQVDVFTVDVKRGKFAHLTVEQKGVAVVAILKGPDGKALVTADNRTGPF